MQYRATSVLQSIAFLTDRQTTNGRKARQGIRPCGRPRAPLPARAIGLTSLTVSALLGLEPGATYAVEDQNAPPAAATANNGQEVSRLHEVVVTARLRKEAIINVPGSVTAISSAMIDDAHMTQIDDIGQQVTNLDIFQGHDNLPAVTLRGIGAFDLTQGVGFYVNDIQLFDGQTIRPVDLERIEVLKGPQGTLYGGANIGGAIKYVTQDPTADWENQATVEFGQYATRDYEAVASGPLIAGGALGLRASFYDDNNGGYIDDTYRKVNYGNTADHGGRVTLASAPTERTKIHLYLSVDDLRSGNEELNYTPPDSSTYSYSVNDYFVPYYRRRLWSAALRLDQQLSDNVAFTSLTSYFASYDRGGIDLAKQPVPIDFLLQNQDHRAYSQELRLASTGQSNLDWVIGLFLQGVRTNLDAIDNFSTGDVNNPVFVGTDIDADYKLQRNYAIFGDATYHYDKWSFELGARETYYKSYERAYNNTVTPIAAGAAQLSGNEALPRASAQYRFRPDLNAYVTVARGFQPGDEVEESGLIHPLQPERVTSYEAGVKSLVDHVRLDAAVFFLDYSNRLFLNSQVLPSVGVVDLTSNIGSSKNYGAELDATTALPYGFLLSAGAGWLQAKWRTAYYVQQGTVTPIDLAGRTAPYSPAYSANLALDWDHRLGDGYRTGFRVEGSAYGRSYWDPLDLSYQHAYQMLNVGLHVESDLWTLAFNLKNATGTRFNTDYSAAAISGAPFNIARINPPRWFVASLTVRF